MMYSPAIAFLGWVFTTTLCTVIACLGDVVLAIGLMLVLDFLTGVLAVEYAYRRV